MSKDGLSANYVFLNILYVNKPENLIEKQA